MLAQVKERRMQGAEGYNKVHMHLFQGADVNHYLLLFELFCGQNTQACVASP